MCFGVLLFGVLLFGVWCCGTDGLDQAPSKPTLMQRLADFKKSRRPLAPAHTHGDYHVFDTTPFALNQSVTHDPRPRHAIGVADRNGPTIDIQKGVINAELFLAVKNLHGKGFVEFPQSYV